MDAIETGTRACAQPGVSHWKVAFFPKAGEGAVYIFGPRGQRNPLKRLDSDKEIQENPKAFLWRSGAIRRLWPRFQEDFAISNVASAKPVDRCLSQRGCAMDWASTLLNEFGPCFSPTPFARSRITRRRAFCFATSRRCSATRKLFAARSTSSCSPGPERKSTRSPASRRAASSWAAPWRINCRPASCRSARKASSRTRPSPSPIPWSMASTTWRCMTMRSPRANA